MPIDLKPPEHDSSDDWLSVMIVVVAILLLIALVFGLASTGRTSPADSAIWEMERQRGW